MTFSLFKLVHFLGAVLWIGGVAAVALAASAVPEEARDKAGPALRGAALKVGTTGMLLAWAGGLSMLLTHWSSLYAKAGWMHGKLALVLLAAGLSGAVSGQLRKMASGQGEVKPGVLKGMAIGLMVIAAIVVALGTLKPGA